MIKKLFLIAACLLTFGANGQMDTLRICTYNVLHYGRPQANRYLLKNSYLRPILASIQPEIVGFNEIDTTLPGVLDTLNTAMPYVMQHGGVHNTTQTDILDALFWKSGTFIKTKDTIICNYLRDIVAYDLYYNDPELGRTHDTVKLKVITAHLKSSNAVADRVVRDTETKIVRRYLERLSDTANVVMMGDFNLYRSAENAYQNLTVNSNSLARLNDPANAPGIWDGNAAFAALHTQSPRLSQLSDEGASGGLDSRFDFILVSDAMLQGARGLTYLPGSYTAFGNDGLHFNKDLRDTPAHPTLPASLIQALYSCSDHLPVYADFVITPKTISVPQPNALVHVPPLQEAITIANPFGQSIRYNMRSGTAAVTYRLLSPQGALLQWGDLNGQVQELSIERQLAQGLYFFQLSSKDGRTAVWKLVHP